LLPDFNGTGVIFDVKLDKIGHITDDIGQFLASCWQSFL